MTAEQTPVVLYFDGLCEPNPGGWATFAWVALARDGSVVAQGGKISPPTRTNTNNWAEYSRVHLTQSVVEWVPREKNARADTLCLELLPPEARPVVEAAIARRQQLRRR